MAYSKQNGTEGAESHKEKIYFYQDQLFQVDKALAVNPTHADLLTIKKDLLEILTILKFPEGSELEAGKGIGASDILDFDKVVQLTPEEAYQNQEAGGEMTTVTSSNTFSVTENAAAPSLDIDTEPLSTVPIISDEVDLSPALDSSIQRIQTNCNTSTEVLSVDEITDEILLFKWDEIRKSKFLSDNKTLANRLRSRRKKLKKKFNPINNRHRTEK